MPRGADGFQNGHDENVVESKEFSSDPSMKGVFSNHDSEVNGVNGKLGNR